MNDNICMPDECSWSCSSSDDDFKQKLLLHCEAHAHEDKSLVDTTFDEDEDEESALSFTIFQIETGPSPSEVNIVTQDSTSKAINVVFTVHEEESGIEVTMQRICSSCAMDVDFDRKCPFCVAAKKFDLNCQENSASLGLDLDLHLTHTDEEDFECNNNKQEHGIHHKADVACEDGFSTKRARNKDRDRIMRGMIATCLQQNKILSVTSSQPTKEVIESRDDASPIIRQKTITGESRHQCDLSNELRKLNVRKETIEKYMLLTSSRRSLDKLEDLYSTFHERSKVKVPDCEPNIIEPSMIAAAQVFHTGPALSNHVDELDVRYQLMQLEKYYSKQQRMDEPQIYY